MSLHSKDNRYLYCLDRLAEQQGTSFNTELIERPDLYDVQLFDEFYQDFRQIIHKIADDMDETDTLLLNISSGTPAMKSGLLVLATLGEYPCRLIQVRTPVKRMNQHKHDKDYDVKALWELNEDNEADFENRCQEVQCPTLSLIKQEEIIKKLILSYDYFAAREVCDMLPESVSSSYRPWLDLACTRLHLDFAAMNLLDKELNSDCLPIKSKDKQEYFEYTLNLSIKLKKKEYTDFIRAITPLIVDLFKLILKHECNIDINEYITDKRWDKLKLKKKNKELDDFLNNSFGGDFHYNEVYSVQLLRIIEHYSNNQKLISLTGSLRNIEANVRNKAAHEIISLSEERIKKLTGGKDSEEILKMLKEALKYTGIGISAEDWNSYDLMNEKILHKIENSCSYII